MGSAEAVRDALASQASSSDIVQSSRSTRKFELGDCVRITDMGRRGELNGSSGSIVESVPDPHGRVCVRIRGSNGPSGEEKVMRILANRLTLEEDSKNSVMSMRLPPGVKDASKLGFHGFGVCM